MKIVLIGYMGSGKSTIGKALSKKLSYTFKDLDSEIEKVEEKKITAIFSEKGEIYFRKKENEVLRNLLSKKNKLVLSTGGGTPCYGTIMDYLTETDNVVPIYLKASLDVLTERLYAEKEKRPLISHLESKENLQDFIRKHLFERSFVYNKAALVISVDDKDVSEVVEEIILKLL
ncbi:shikimate kinase [uncultured Marixanthomonas sp.]|uniref:shikimate kinase n=1 Tax=uncultured Marixanthomonas sp. TaxID=757245 RepID=UPI0030DBD200|tara:strand:+ start:22390 stop:22911 length:522 start_codon:yes stop_codon:yes gene_type:complete